MTAQTSNKFIYNNEECYSLNSEHCYETSLVPREITTFNPFVFDYYCTALLRGWIAYFEISDRLYLNKLYVMPMNSYPKIKEVDAIINEQGAIYSLNLPIEYTGIIELAKYGTRNYFAKISFKNGKVINETVKNEEGIRNLAKSLWIARGCPEEGSEEIDWKNAEKQLGWEWHSEIDSDPTGIKYDLKEAARILNMI